jgi:hypothetical protein
VRSKCMKLLTQLLDRYADKPVAAYWAPLMTVLGPAAARLEVEVAGAGASGARTPATLELLTILSHHSALTPALGADPRVLPGALRCIAAGRGLGGADGPTSAALCVVEGMLSTAEAEAAAGRAATAMPLLLPHVQLLLDQLRLRVVQTLGAPPEESAALTTGILTRHQKAPGAERLAGGGGGGAGKGKGKRAPPPKVHVPMRELALMQRLVPHVGMSHARAVRLSLSLSLSRELALQRLVPHVGMSHARAVRLAFGASLCWEWPPPQQRTQRRSKIGS